MPEAPKRARAQRLTGNPSGRQNALLIVVDALRSDYFLSPGAQLSENYPNLAQLMTESCDYREVWAGANSTHLALPTMLNGTFAYDRQSRPAFRILAEHVGATLRAYAAPLASAIPGYVGVESEPGQSASEMVDEVLRNLPSDIGSGRPFIYYVHFFDVHMKMVMSDLINLFTGDSVARRRYVEQVRMVDHALGRLIRELKDAGEWPRTVVILTADHGELLNERGVSMHGGPLFEPAVRVPLLIKRTSEACRYLGIPLSGADVYPMLLEHMRVERESDPDDLVWPPSPLRTLVTYEYLGGRQIALISRSRKYVLDAALDLREVYDLAKDPSEVRNIMVTADRAEAYSLLRHLPRLMSVVPRSH